MKEKPLLGDRIMVAIVNLNQAAEPIIRDHVGQSGSHATQRCTRGRKIGEQRMQRVEGMWGVGWGVDGWSVKKRWERDVVRDRELEWNTRIDLMSTSGDCHLDKLGQQFDPIYIKKTIPGIILKGLRYLINIFSIFVSLQIQGIILSFLFFDYECSSLSQLWR